MRIWEIAHDLQVITAILKVAKGGEKADRAIEIRLTWET
jgi:hypothetical protein